ncbi:hypothetical protein RJD38_21135 [Vibrio scophthalmi]|uniref:hypothetical protein n=1 Tax=Vibrio scophthalmi TaxID=45658 RepID=UPI00349FC666
MNKYEHHFHDWKGGLYACYAFRQNPAPDEEELAKNDIRIQKLLSEMLAIARKESRIKATFSHPQPVFTLIGDAVSISSDKLNLTVTFGIFNGKFYLEASFNHPEHMGKVDDDFWCNLARLSKLGELEFQEHASPETKLFLTLQKRHRATKSAILKVIQHYIICTDDDSFNDGSLEISWEINTPFHDLLGYMSEAFCCLYNMNYQLYRRDYIIQKSRIKRQKNSKKSIKYINKG